MLYEVITDLLTIAPKLLKELDEMEGTLVKKLNADDLGDFNEPKISLDEKLFRWMMNEDAMATEKLAEGIRKFAADIVKLEDKIKAKL